MNNIKNLNFTKLFDDNVLLAQIIALILFFECYNLVFNDTSMANLTFDIKKLTILPFIVLFAAIAMSKVLWFLIVCKIPSKPSKGATEISTRTSYTSFTLSISLSSFIYVTIISDHTLFQINYNVQPYLYVFLWISIISGLIGGVYVFLSYSPVLGNWK